MRLAASCLMAALLACAGDGAQGTPPPAKGGLMRVTSSAFNAGEAIPALYTCDAEERIPPLSFSGVPATAKSLALLVDDPDAPAGVWTHWVVWNLPPSLAGVTEGKEPPGVVGRNGLGKNAWEGPCPPKGSHRYFFRLYALDRELALDPSASRTELLRAIEGHVVESAELMGKYERRR